MSDFHATTGSGQNFKTKKALREAVAAGQPVRFSDTSAFANRGEVWSASDLRELDVIVGPDPYRDRRWYANIKKGKVV